MKSTLRVLTNTNLTSPRNDAVTTPLTPKDEAMMRSVLERDFVDHSHHNIVTVATSAHKPSPSKEREEILVKIRACSLSNTDDSNLGKRKRDQEKEDEVLMDIVGIVEEASCELEKCAFKTGDMILATDVSLEVRGVPEFTTIDTARAVVVPTGVDPVNASACGDAAIALAMIDNVVIGDRVLIIGGGNSPCGAAATQLSRLAGASHVAITTGPLIHAIKLATKVDKVIAEGEDWMEDPNYMENKFDKIIDCSFREVNDPSKTSKVLKSNSNGGKLIHLRSFIQSTRNRKNNGLSRVLRLLKDKKLNITLDPSSPLPFSEEGVEMAYELHTNGNCRGRIVIQVK